MVDTTTRPTSTTPLEDMKPFNFAMGDKAAEEKKRAWIPFQKDMYVAELTDIRMSKGKAYMSEEEIDQVEVTLNLLKTIEGGAVMNADGEPVEKTFVRLWFSPEAVGYNKKTGEPNRLRAFLTALCDVPTEAPLTVNENDLLGKKLKVMCDVTAKDGVRKNKFSGFMPYKQAA